MVNDAFEEQVTKCSRTFIQTEAEVCLYQLWSELNQYFLNVLFVQDQNHSNGA